jgi:hypothetical protein
VAPVVRAATAPPCAAAINTAGLILRCEILGGDGGGLIVFGRVVNVWSAPRAVPTVLVTTRRK